VIGMVEPSLSEHTKLALGAADKVLNNLKALAMSGLSDMPAASHEAGVHAAGFVEKVEKRLCPVMIAHALAAGEVEFTAIVSSGPRRAPSSRCSARMRPASRGATNNSC
jgi:hypothetical protein